ncbi:MAG TPA: sigma 54-interacting transcriptional regulator, partial [Rhodocyclaceae bacterium]
NAQFEQIFRQSVKAVLDHATVRGSDPLALVTAKGLTLQTKVIPGALMKTPLRVFTFPRAEAVRAEKRPPVVEQRESSLDQLDTGDPHVRAVLHKVRRVLGKDIPVLIHGETGAGKELLARAIHDDGPRFDKPFVAVNCAAIPEGLIESELFGYEEGAFTGAKRKGNGGRIQQADGGTLFLDEIGDMPAALQARLLRVLQERVVNPLGSTKSIPVDIVLVCATHRRLKELVAEGTFREDLYYRLNGLTVNLPPLRSRTDLAPLVALILTRLQPPNTPLPQIEPEVLELFVRHPWPGNIRQLSNLLRTALVMAGDSDCITVDHMPDDFLEEFEAVEQVPSQAHRVSAPTATAGATASASPTGLAEAGAGDLESTTLNLIQRALEQHAGNVSAAARQLGISRNTLYRKLKQIWKL